MCEVVFVYFFKKSFYHGTICSVLFLSGKAYQDPGFVSCLLVYSKTALFFFPIFNQE